MAKTKPILALSDLTPDTQNANKGTERGRFMVEASLTETGAGRSIVADRDGRIIAGNKTLEAWAGMGGAVKVVETDGHELVVVQRTDLDLSDPKGKARKLAYYDNRAGQVGLEWDAAQLLADVNAGVDLAAMFKADEIAELLAGVKGGAEADAEPQIDQAEELNKKWQVKTGDLWRIGAHRLLCGDSTKAADVTRVLRGDVPLLCVTDPPYGVEYDANWRNEADRANGKPYGDRAVGKVENDNRADWRETWALFPGDVVYSWHPAGAPSLVHGKALQDSGFTIRMQIVWAKNQFPIGRGDYHVKHEPCWYAVRDGKPSHMVNDRTQHTLWEIDKPHKSDTGHSTQKPLECMAKPIRNHISEMVYEPFAGSGTTLVACENLGRKARAIEISPAYCAVILERMAQAFPKLEITRDDAS